MYYSNASIHLINSLIFDLSAIRSFWSLSYLYKQYCNELFTLIAVRSARWRSFLQAKFPEREDKVKAYVIYGFWLGFGHLQE